MTTVFVSSLQTLLAQMLTYKRTQLHLHPSSHSSHNTISQPRLLHNTHGSRGRYSSEVWRWLHVCHAKKTARRSSFRKPIVSSLTKQPIFVSVHPDGSDTWRLDPIIDLIKKGGVGIIPTDTLPAVVCDMENRDAIRRLYMVKHMHPKKPLSLLCRGFSDIGTYTTGFPISNEPGIASTFSILKQMLPGPYTLILHASKQLPKQLVDYDSNKVKQRRSVGIRWPSDVVCQAILNGVGRPLIASSMHIDHDENEDFELSNGVVLMDAYNDSGIDFMVSIGSRTVQESTIIDMTEREPVIVREGSGDLRLLKQAHAL